MSTKKYLREDFDLTEWRKEFKDKVVNDNVNHPSHYTKHPSGVEGYRYNKSL